MGTIGSLMPVGNPVEIVEYEIRQQVRSVKETWLPVVYSGRCERVATDEYNRLAREYPGEYFELVKVVRVQREECLAFTTKEIGSERGSHAIVEEKGDQNGGNDRT